MGRRQALTAALLALVASVAAGQSPTRIAPAPVRPVTSVPAAPPISAPIGKRTLEVSDLDSWLDGYVPHALSVADIPGAVVVVVKDGRILTARGFGYADVASKTKVDPQRTLFRIGSVSKLFTWTAAMQLVEQGKLNLDRDVNDYLDFRIPPLDGKPVTLRQLMTHTGGFEDTGKSIITYDPRYQPTLDGYLRRWTPKRIFKPGTTPAYSNWGTALTAYIIERTSGQNFDNYLEHHIFQPLGMADTSFRQPLPSRLRASLATGYPSPGIAKGFEYIGPSAAGSGSSTGPDMARFMIAHLQRGELGGHRILNAQTADMMHQSPLNNVDPASLIPPLNRMELGFFETNVNGHEVIGHLGDVQAFHTSLHLFLKDGVGLYASFNSSGRDGAVQGLRTALFQDFADRYFPELPSVSGRVDARTAAQHTQMMAGQWMASRRNDSSFLSSAYWLAGQTKIVVGPKGELVIPSLLTAGGRPRQWIEVAPFVWNEVGGHERVAAKVAGGQIIRWSFAFASPFEVFDRVPSSVSASWLLPSLYAALAILLLTFLRLPVAAIARRAHKVGQPLTGVTLKASRAVSVMAVVTIGLVVFWGITLIPALGDPNELNGQHDGLYLALQFASAVVFFGMAGIAAWNCWLTWRDRRTPLRRLGSVLIVLSALLLLYVALRFHLMAMTVNY